MLRTIILTVILTISSFATSFEINKGWTLLGSDVYISDPNTTFENCNSLWTYKGSSWQAISPNNTLTSDFLNANINSVVEINAGDGFWLNCDQNNTLTTLGVSTNNNVLEIKDQGWHLKSLIGATSMDVSEFFDDNNISTVWKYYENEWQAFSPNENTQTLLKNANVSLMTTINSGEGFWINSKSSLSLSPPTTLFKNYSTYISSLSTTLNNQIIENALIAGKQATLQVSDLNTTNIELYFFYESGGGTTYVTVSPDAIYETNNTILFTPPSNLEQGAISLAGDQVVYDTVEYAYLPQGYPILNTLSPEIVKSNEEITLNVTNIEDGAVAIVFESNETIIKETTCTSGVIKINIPENVMSGKVYVYTLNQQITNPLHLSVKNDTLIQINANSNLGLDPTKLFIVLNGIDHSFDENFQTTLQANYNDVHFVDILYEYEDNNYTRIYSTAILPNTSSINVDANSTAISLLLQGMSNVFDLEPTQNEILYSIAISSPKVASLAANIDSKLQGNITVLDTVEDADLLTKLEDAAKEVLEQFIDTGNTLQKLISITSNPTSDKIYLEDTSNGGVSLVNKSGLYLSVQATSKEDGKIINNIKHIDHINIMNQKDLISPYSSKELYLSGKDSDMEVVTGAYTLIKAPTDQTELNAALAERTFVDGVVVNAINVVLNVLIDKKLNKSSSKDIITGLNTIYDGDFVVKLKESMSQKELSISNVLSTLVTDPIKNKLKDGCMVSPTGAACEAFVKGIAQMAGIVDKDKIFQKLMSKFASTVSTKASKRAAKAALISATTGGWGSISVAISNAYDVLKTAYDVSSFAFVVSDMSNLDREYNFAIDFPLEVNSLSKTCYVINGSTLEMSLNLYGEGFQSQTDSTAQVALMLSLTDEVVASSVNTVSDTQLDATFATYNNKLSEYGTNNKVYPVVQVDGQTILYSKEPIRIVYYNDEPLFFDSIEQSSGTQGENITLKGCGWTTDDIYLEVYFKYSNGYTKGEIISKTDESLVVTVPDNAISGNIYVQGQTKKSEGIYLQINQGIKPPTISPESSAFTDTQQITLSHSDNTVQIYYSLNGGNEVLYSGSFAIDATTTISYYAKYAENNLSQTMQASYAKCAENEFINVDECKACDEGEIVVDNQCVPSDDAGNSGTDDWDNYPSPQYCPATKIYASMFFDFEGKPMSDGASKDYVYCTYHSNKTLFIESPMRYINSEHIHDGWDKRYYQGADEQTLGTLSQKEYWDNGIHKTYLAYHENGQISYTNFYDSEGKLDGQSTSYDEMGKIKSFTIYSNGVMVSRTSYTDYEGDFYDNGAYEVYEYDLNGDKKTYTWYNGDGSYSVTTYDSSDQELTNAYYDASGSCTGDGCP